MARRALFVRAWISARIVWALLALFLVRAWISARIVWALCLAAQLAAKEWRQLSRPDLRLGLALLLYEPSATQCLTVACV